MAWLWTLGSIVASFAAALAFHLALRWRRRGRLGAWLTASLIVAMAPGLVPLSERPRRLIAAMVAAALLVKLYDLFQQPALAQSLTLPSYALYLVNWFWLVLPKRPPGVPAAHDRNQLALTVPLLLVMAGISIGVFSGEYSGMPLVIEHSLKVTVLAATIISLFNVAARVWRLLGGVALDPMLNPALARTPADFWRRWNRPAQQFFREYAFRASGGARHPVRGVLAAFTASGILHEYVFGIATGRVQGWQLIYFALNGVAAAATIRLRPRGWLAAPLVAGTIVLNLVLAGLFFKSVNSVVPFYSPRAP